MRNCLTHSCKNKHKLYKIQKKRIECGWLQTCREKLTKNFPQWRLPQRSKSGRQKSVYQLGKIAPEKKRGKSFHHFENRVKTKKLDQLNRPTAFQNLVAWSDVLTFLVDRKFSDPTVAKNCGEIFAGEPKRQRPLDSTSCPTIVIFKYKFVGRS